jgi:sugar phosphate isomerase/epimerase
MKAARTPVWPRLGVMAHELGLRPGETESLISLLQGFGMRAVQLGTPLLEEVLVQPELIARWRARLEAAEIALVAIGGYRNLIAPNAAKRRENIAFLQRCLELAPQLGTAIVATETGTRNRESEWAPSPENQGKEAWDILCATLRELLPVAEQHGTILALEGHVNHVINTPERLARLFVQFPTPHLQVVLDPYNYLGQDALPQKEHLVTAFLRQFKDRFVLAHLKDVSPQGAESSTPAFGQGVFPQRIYLDFLRNECPGLPLILEHVSIGQIPDVLQRGSGAQVPSVGSGDSL